MALSFVDDDEIAQEALVENSLIILALRIRDIDLFGKLLNYHPDLSTESHEFNQTPLQDACTFGCSRRILRQMLDLDKTSQKNGTMDHRLILLAIQTRRAKLRSGMVSELLAAGLDPNTKSQISILALMQAASLGDDATVTELLRCGADVSEVDENGWNVLSHAINPQSLPVLYCAKGSQVSQDVTMNINIRGHAYRHANALHLAAGLGSAQVVFFLLDNGLVLDINAVTICGRSALHIAALCNQYRIVGILLHRNADHEIKNLTHGATALHWAAFWGYTNVISTFIDHGCVVEVCDNSGLTPVLTALRRGHDKIARVLSDFHRANGKRKRYLFEYVFHSLILLTCDRKRFEHSSTGSRCRRTAIFQAVLDCVAQTRHNPWQS